MMIESGGGFFFFVVVFFCFFFFYICFKKNKKKKLKKKKKEYKMIKYARENRGKIIKGINNNTVLEMQNSTPPFLFYFFIFIFSSISRPVRPDIIVVVDWE